MAQALGFGSFAERALLLAAPKGPEEVKYFLETLSNNLRPYLNNDIKLLQTQLQTSTVGPWDVNCVDGGSRKRDISNHLNIYKCFDGFSQLAEILFGVKLERAEPLEGEIWHQDVIKFNVSHKEHGDYGYMALKYNKREHEHVCSWLFSDDSIVTIQRRIF
jgi:Zn-dependent oligopeptidase